MQIPTDGIRPIHITEDTFVQANENTHSGRVYELSVIEEAAIIPEEAFDSLTIEESKPDIPITLQIAMEELQKCLKLAQKYKTEIANEKTTAKKNYLKKKSHKNSMYAAKILIFVEKYKQNREQIILQQAVNVADTTCEPQVV